MLSCSNKVEQQKNKPVVKFQTRDVILDADTPINSIQFKNGYLFCLQQNGQMIVLDSKYKRVGELEKKFDSHLTYLIAYHDTVYLGNNKKAYFLSSDCSPISYSFKHRIYGEPFFQDSIYQVTGCCMGEFGGSVSFINRVKNKTYSYFATCPMQVLRFKNEYVVCNNLAHLEYHGNFLFIKDPTRLYDITDYKEKNYCNWYVTVDSLKDYSNLKKPSEVREYSMWDAMSLLTFPYQDTLYSIISTSKATILSVHRQDSLYTIDTIKPKMIHFHDISVTSDGTRMASLYRLTGGSPVAAFSEWGNESGIIVANGTHIDFLQMRK